jgi:hypothetical protein
MATVLAPIIDRDTARELLRQVMPDWEGMLEELERTGGRISFPSEFSLLLDNLNLKNYPLLYERPEAVGLLLMQAVFDPAEVVAFNAKVERATPAERGRTVMELVEEFAGFDSFMAVPSEEQAQAREAFDAMEPERKQAIVKLVQHLMAGALVMFYEYLSVAVHGEKLSSLVARAKQGDDDAYAKAVQIDGRILTVVPYFENRYARACTEDHQKFLAAVGRKRASPPYKGRITHKSLFMTFAFLEGCELLQMFSGEELLDFCDGVGVGASGQRIDDVKNLRKRLADYRRFQRQGRKSTP